MYGCLRNTQVLNSVYGIKHQQRHGDRFSLEIFSPSDVNKVWCLNFKVKTNNLATLIFNTMFWKQNRHSGADLKYWIYEKSKYSEAK